MKTGETQRKYEETAETEDGWKAEAKSRETAGGYSRGFAQDDGARIAKTGLFGPNDDTGSTACTIL